MKASSHLFEVGCSALALTMMVSAGVRAGGKIFAQSTRPVAVQTLEDSSDPRLKSLYCAYGGIGLKPVPLPPGYETQFAVAVVELNSPSQTANVAVMSLEMFDKTGNATKSKRIVEVEVFLRTRVATEGEMAYYLNSGGTVPWNGTLPAGRIRLRVRVVLAERPIEPVRFRLTVGQNVIDGRVDAEWPT